MSENLERKIYIIIGILGILFAISMIVWAIIDNIAENDCEEQKRICYRIEPVFLGVHEIETRCEGSNWDIQKIECIDRGYFWEKNE